MDYSKQTVTELKILCKDRGVTGFSTKGKYQLMKLLEAHDAGETQIKPRKIEPMEPSEPIKSIKKLKEPKTDEQNVKDQYIYQMMPTYIGNKRRLIPDILKLVEEVSNNLGKKKLNIVDGFSGTSIVSRALSKMADTLYTNDLEPYSVQMSKCYLETPTDEQKERIQNHINTMNELAENGPYEEGFVSKLYAPKDTNDIQEGERCFYTRENALIIDTLRKYIEDEVEEDIQTYCLVPLITRAAINTNAACVFKAFYKRDGLGCFDTMGQAQTDRITRPIRLEMPVWSTESFTSVCSNKDVNELVKELPANIDLMYFDPPYSIHPYGSNYFMLNLIASNEEPTDISKVVGIPTEWNKSLYNKKATAMTAMNELLEESFKKTKYVLLSYNAKGLISEQEMETILEPYIVKKYEFQVSTKDTEFMYLISK
jgi:adenine-specific DNA-methyltransferase